MKKFFKLFFLCFCCIAFTQEPTTEDPPEVYEIISSEQNTNERILFFNSDIKVAENADITITETITAYATGNVIKRGLFRALPMIRNINGGQERITYKVISIKKDGREENYHTEIKNGVFNIYIGNKDIVLQPGTYNYEIKYKTQDQIGHFGTYDEFYWNVNGTDWGFPIEKIQATLTLPIGATILQNSCYTGKSGSTKKNCASENLSSTKITFIADHLNAKENLTIAVGFKAGVLKEPSAFMKWLNKNWPSLFLILGVLYLIYFCYDNWRKYGKDPHKPVVIPQFNAPGNKSPAMLGYISKGEFSITHVTANLVDLAIRGFIKIDEVKDDVKKSTLSKIFTIKKLAKEDDKLQDDQKILLKKIFGTTKQITVNGTYNTKIKNAVHDFKVLITNENKKYTETTANSKLVYKALKIMLIIFFSALVINALVTWSFNGLVLSLFIVLFDGFFIVVLLYLWGLKSKISFFGFLVFSIGFFVPVFFLAAGKVEDLSTFESDCFKFLIIGTVSLIVFRYLIIKPSEEKVKMEAEIEGFKMYLGTAEENQLKFHNPPEMTSDLYEKFLPYAIVFGVEGIWGKRFRDQLNQTVKAESPSHLQDQLGYNFASSFSGVLAESTISPRSFSFSSSSSSSSSSSRSSSSSSYSGGSSSSGSSGGGSSGGGGGGGGGGGW